MNVCVRVSLREFIPYISDLIEKQMLMNNIIYSPCSSNECFCSHSTHIPVYMSETCFSTWLIICVRSASAYLFNAVKHVDLSN